MTCNTFGEIIFKNEVVMWDLLLLSALLERAYLIHLITRWYSLKSFNENELSFTF